MASDKPIPAPESKDTGFTPGDDSWTRWRNSFALMMGRLSPEGQRQYLKARDDREEVADCKRCEKWRDYCLSYSKSALNLAFKQGLVGLIFSNYRSSCNLHEGEDQSTWRRYT